MPRSTAVSMSRVIGATVMLIMSLASCPRSSDNAKSQGGSQPAETRAAPGVDGWVISMDGHTVVGASVVAAGHEAVTDHRGRFHLAGIDQPVWVTVRADGYVPRTRPAAPTAPVLVRLTPDDGQTITLKFVGDLMFGRRFFDPNEVGYQYQGRLPVSPTVEAHEALFDDVAPLLDDADVTFGNLETVLSAAPFIDPAVGGPRGGARPFPLHPTKDYVFASHPNAAVALRRVGFDVLGLANNHLFDYQAPGLSETFAALEDAGWRRGTSFFGAGLNESEAWQPASIDVRGARVAFLGCTTITGEEHRIAYVASDRMGQGGAAACDDDRVRQAVREAARTRSLVVFMVHGGFEYGAEPSITVRRMTAAAREAGAVAVVNHHPHVLGGLDWTNGTLAAWTIGNFVFDQQVWPTFPSGVLTIQIREGKVVRAYLEPVLVAGFAPAALTGIAADGVSRAAAGLSTAPAVLEDGALELDLAGTGRPRTAAPDIAGGVAAVGPGWSITDPAVRHGRDLLGVGSFDGGSVGEVPAGDALWTLDRPRVDIRRPSRGADGVARLTARPGDATGAVLTPRHRIPAAAGAELSLVARVTAAPRAEVTAELHWYTDLQGNDAGKVTRRVDGTELGATSVLRLDATVPAGAVAVGVEIRLAAPKSAPVTADVDDIALVHWAAAGTAVTAAHTHVDVDAPTSVALSRTVLAGALEWLDAARPPPVRAP